ncbi:MAG: hypothetical protein JSW71_09440 [Gemmatimonadota bacterium]|nr:MAG: hypothetical protein JSW71_09440 [Gemmatimonadota bacterium]
MRLSTKLGAWTIAAVLAVAACGDDEGATGVNGSTFTAAEKSALMAAITNTGAFEGTPAAAYASFALMGLDEVGTISAGRSAAIDQAIESGISLAVSGMLASRYDAVGVQLTYDIQGQTGWFIGVVGWTGLNTTTNTVDELIAVYSYGDGTTAPSTVQGSFGGDIILVGAYWNGARYYAVEGNASITASGFSGSTDCSITGYTCSYSQGTMSGNFGFTAEAAETTDTYEQVPVSFTGLPAVSVTISDGS